ncbi:hypothetical protein [Profundibacter sp.]|uniref:hypothetical protein n=1 Tax=Profundibacter sp. TaxID=3101071 RepID=UPI003D14EABD
MKLPHLFSKQNKKAASETTVLGDVVEYSNAQTEPLNPIFQTLSDFIGKTPAAKFLSAETTEQGWWVRMEIDIHHNLAWQVVQEYGYVLNNVSFTEKLPTVFKPTSPPPYMNGGPEDFLTWIIECHVNDFRPELAKEWLEGRLPRPIGDLTEWEHSD